MSLTLDPDHPDNGLKDRSLQVGTSRKTNANDGTARSNVLSGLLEWLLVDGDEDDGVRTKTIRCSLLYIGDEILGCCEVDKYLAAELGDHLLLLVTGVDTDDTASHCLCVLASKRSETTTSTNDSDPLTGFDFGLLQSFVDSNTRAENRGDSIKCTLLGDAGNVGSLSNAVLLESTIDCVTRKKGLCAERLVGLLAEVASQTGSVDPLDTSVIANLDIIDELTLSNDDTGTLVTTNKR
jgi:hypothetical protein